MSKAIDFDSLDTGSASEKPHEFELTHPASKKPLGVFLNVLGPESRAHKEKVKRQINRDRMREFQAVRNPRKAEPSTFEEDEAFGLELTAELVKGWRTVTEGKSEQVIVWKGEKLDFNEDNLTRWLSNFQWVIPQINEFTNDLGNFLGN